MEIETIQIKLRKAEACDLKDGEKRRRWGQPFWLKSKHTGKFDNKQQIIDEDTDVYELARWLQEGMIYVPASDLDLNNEGDELRTN